MSTNRRVCGLAVAVCAMMASACGGEGGEEAVFLYFINGYPGTGAMTVNGNTGVIATNVPFGERFGDDGESCGPERNDCLPVRVERQQGATFTFILENMIERAQVDFELFSMYPHETGTVVLTRRGAETDVDVTLLRHTQSISSDCTITFVNGLSLDNEYIGTFGSFSISPEALVPDIGLAGFGDEVNTPFISECGALPTDDTHQAVQAPRLAVIEAIKANPWFMLVCDDDSENDEFCQFRWGVPYDQGRVRIGEGGGFPSVLDSEEYYECVQGGISIRNETDEVTGQPFDTGNEPDCPRDDMGNRREMTWADVDIDFQALQECNEPIRRSAIMQEPGQPESTQSYQGFPVCDMEFRIRNEGPDIVFGPEDGESLGSHGNGQPIQSEIDVPAGSQRFYVLLGRPVNPIVWQWDSAETFVDLSFYPYFNEGGERPDIGDYDK